MWVVVFFIVYFCAVMYCWARADLTLTLQVTYRISRAVGQSMLSLSKSIFSRPCSLLNGCRFVYLVTSCVTYHPCTS
jgi:hypothetical protein